MENFGFIKVGTAIPDLRVADCTFNAGSISDLITKAADQNVQILCFPELCITGYTCNDLFHQEILIKQAQISVADILAQTRDLNICFIIGAPVFFHGKLFNTAIIGYKGKIMGIVPKTYLPNYNEFYEKRWFASANDMEPGIIEYCGQTVPFGTNILFGETSCSFSVEICEDLWAVIPPSSRHTLNGATMIFNLSASNELIGKNSYRESLVKQQSARCIAGYIYVAAGCGESTTDLVFTGSGIICENGTILSRADRFLFEEQLTISEIDTGRLIADRQKNTTFEPETASEYRLQQIPLLSYREIILTREVNPLPFIPSGDYYNESCEEIFSIQVGGLAKRLTHTKAKTAVIGISGGLDSTLALLVCAKTFDKLGISRKNILGITMPGYGTTDRTYNNALLLMQSLGISTREINIKEACEQHFKDIEHDPSVHDVTFENTQARERTQILMDIANQTNGLVIGTGDMSELALGWATYNGDHMSMYAVNCSIPKTLVRHLVNWVAATQVDTQSADTLKDIANTPVSPELLPADSSGNIIQKTEDIVGPYELHDFFLYYLIRYGFSPSKIYFLAKCAFKETYQEETILKWLEIFFRRFFNQQFKRSCLPDGPKVGSINLSPRGDWRMPSDACSNIWIEEIRNLKKS